MKQTIFFFFFALICFSVSAQVSEERTKEQHAMALERMVLFVLTKDVTTFNEATEMLKETKTMYETLQRRASSNSIEKIIFEAKVTTVDTHLILYGDYFKGKIMKDTDKQSKEVKFMDKEYKISKEQKKAFDDLQSFVKSARK